MFDGYELGMLVDDDVGFPILFNERFYHFVDSESDFFQRDINEAISEVVELKVGQLRLGKYAVVHRMTNLTVYVRTLR